MAYQAHSITTDDLARLTTSITVTTTPTTGTVAYIDLGDTPVAYSVNTTSAKPYIRFAVTVNWGALTTSTDEAYYVTIEGSNTTNFASVERLGLLLLGNATPTGNSVATPPNGQGVIYGDNRAFKSASDANNTSAHRYLRLRVSGFGTAPSIVITGAWLNVI